MTSKPIMPLPTTTAVSPSETGVRFAACTAMAGELLGLRTIYMDTGSGAERTVHPDMVAAVRKAVELPIIIGGGIRDAHSARLLCEAGADVLVVGTAFEEDPERIFAMSEAVHR